MLGILIGLSVAWSVRLQARRGARPLRDAYLPGMLLFEVLVLTPPVLYLLVRHPRWASLDLYEGEVTGGMAITLVVGSMLLSTLAYLAGFALARSRRNWLLGLSNLAAAGGLAALVGSAASRLAGLDVATEESGAAPALVLAVALPLLLGGWVFLLVLFTMEGRKIHRVRIGTVHPDTLAAEEKPTSAYPARLDSAQKLASVEISEIEDSVESGPAAGNHAGGGNDSAV